MSRTSIVTTTILLLLVGVLAGSLLVQAQGEPDPGWVISEQSANRIVLEIPATPTPTPTNTPTPEPTSTPTPEPTPTNTPVPDMQQAFYSLAADRSSPLVLHGATVSGNVYVFVPQTGISNVTFTLDDGTPRVENNPPYDLVGGTSTAAVALNTLTMDDGEHTLVSVIKPVGVPAVTKTAVFFVDNDQEPGEPTPTPTATATPTQPGDPTPTPTNTPTPTATPTQAPEAGDLYFIPTFENIGVYMDDVGGSGTVPIEWRPTGETDWRDGFPLMIDPETGDVRGSLFGLDPNTSYDVRVLGEEATVSTRDENVGQSSGTIVPVDTAAEIQAALTAAVPGDQIQIAAGTYSGPFTITADGTAGNYITITNDGTGEVVLTGNAGAVNTVLLLNDADYIRVAGLTIRDADANLIKLENGSDHAVIEYNTLIEPAYGRTASVSDTSATVHMRQDSAYPVIRHNTMHRNTVMTTKIGVPATFGWKAGEGAIVYDNVVTGGFEDAFRWAPEDSTSENRAIDLDIYGNTITGACYDDGIQPEGVGINVRIYENVISECFIGMAFAPLIEGPIYIYRNIIYESVHPTRGGSALFKLGDEDPGRRGLKVIVQNTFFSNAPPTDVTSWKQTNSGLGGIYSRNNAFHSSRYVYEGGCDPCDLDYDALWTDDPNRFVQYRGPLYSDIEEWCLEAGQECNGIERDLRDDWTDPENGDFTLVTGSPLVDAGVLLPGFNDLDSAWPYQGSGPDMGALEQ